MRSILLILLSIIFSLSASAQKIHFTDSTNKWNILHYADPFATGHYTDYYIGDTMIHSRNYRIFAYVGSNYASYSSGYVTYVREDTTINKVFVIVNDSEYVYMDYNLNVGDMTWHTDNSGNTTTYQVASIDSVMVNSIYYKVWHYSLVYHTTYPYVDTYHVIEGIGCTNGPLFILDPMDFESIDYLECFYNDSSSSLVAPPVEEAANGSFLFDNLTSCTSPLRSYSVKRQRSITIYPNPATTELTISAPDNITTIAINNLLGQTVYSHEYNSTQVHVDVADLPAGIYFVKVNGVEVRKFIKQ